MKTKDFLLISLLIAIDQLSKLATKSFIKLGQDIILIKDLFYLTYAQNKGAAWSMLTGFGYFFVVIAIVSVSAMIYYLNKNKVGKIEKLGFLLIMAGALGNVIDRLLYGYVIDFIGVYIFTYAFPIFNIADCCITIGVGLLIIDLLFFSKEAK